MNLASLVDHRIALVDCESDARHFGWIQQVSGATLTVQSLRPGPARGLRLSCRVASQQGTATFDVVSLGSRGPEFAVNLEGKLSLATLHEDPRFRIDLDAAILLDGSETAIHIHDVSVRGVGFQAPRPFEPGTETVFAFASFGNLCVEGTIVHCSALENSYVHRIGARLAKMDRIGRARWRRLLQMGDPVLATLQVDALEAAA